MFKNYLLFRYSLISLFIINFFPFSSFAQETFTSIAFGNWKNVNGFSLNQDENLIILEILSDGVSKTILYQSKKVNDIWEEPTPIIELNDFLACNATLGGPFLSYQGTRLYFHANYSDSKGGMDIYYSDWNGQNWSNPINFGEPINSGGNDKSPSMTVTGDKILFTRDNQNPEVKTRKGLTQCQIIHYSFKDILGNWQKPVAVVDPINLDCEASPSIAPDGKTIYFSSERSDIESFDIYYTKEIMKGAWLIPQIVPGTNSENDDLSPQYVNGKLFHLSTYIKKKIFNGVLYTHSIPEDIKPYPTVNIEGKISDLNGNPLEATLQVLNPITSQLIGEFFSNPKSGNYSMALLDKGNYLVNIRKKGYSLGSFQENLSANEAKITEKRNISLFNTISLRLSVFDSEIFRPLISEVKIVDKDSGIETNIKSTNSGNGVYEMELPIGKKYKIIANALGFEPDTMDFMLTDDIVFSQFERKLALKPLKKEFKINVSDSETDENIAAEIVIKNLDRDETIIVSAKDISEGKTTVLLREGDRYEFNIKGPKGYSFYNNTVDLKSDIEKRSLDVELKSLKAQSTITLNNITFEKNSADLNEVSFAELDRVVTLIKDNADLIIEISAHTDDIGTEQYNNKLSERRADSVVKYLTEKGISLERLVAKGYGESTPVVPNTSEENRAQNRRVQFKILGFVDGSN